MKNINDILFIIQARLSSKRVPRKMIRNFADTTLFEIAIKKILNSNIIPKKNFYVSIYEKELIEIAEKYNVNIFLRSKKSRDEEYDLKNLYEWHDKLPFSYAIIINACCPFLSITTIDCFVQNYINTNSDGLLPVSCKKNYFFDKEKKLFNSIVEIGKAMNTKTVDPIYEAVHCLHAGKMNLIKDGIWMGNFQKNNPELFEISEYEGMDIDYEWQFELYENFYRIKENNDNL